MPKHNKIESVLHDWVHTLTFQQQALLLTGLRGPDTLPKYNGGKSIVRYLRGVVLKPAGVWSGENDNDFMWGEYGEFRNHRNLFFSDPDQYPHHFIMHLLHCAEVVGYKHPQKNIAIEWMLFYEMGAKALHMTPETVEQMDRRLNDFGCGVHAIGF